MTNPDSNFTELKRLFEAECELIERKYADEQKPVSIARQHAAKARVLSMMLDGLSIETATDILHTSRTLLLRLQKVKADELKNIT